jgi:malonate transporter
MLTVLTALVPVFLLILLGHALRRILLTHDMMWTGLEQLVYYVLLPALLIDSLARANLASVPIIDAGGALLLAVLLMSALCLSLRYGMSPFDSAARHFSVFLSRIPGRNFEILGRSPL